MGVPTCSLYAHKMNLLQSITCILSLYPTAETTPASLTRGRENAFMGRCAVSHFSTQYSFPIRGGVHHRHC